MHHLNKCSLCNGSSHQTWYRQRVGNTEPWSLFLAPECFPFIITGKICRDCGWMFKNPVFDGPELDRLYNYVDDAMSREAAMFADNNAIYRGRQIFRTVQPWLQKASGKVLDVGGRNGELMRTFSSAGYDVTILDMDAGQPVLPTMRKVRMGFTAWSQATYDLLVLSHILEHTEAPDYFLRHARSLLNPNGLIYVEVPFELITFLFLRHSGDHRHLGYFTRETLRHYLIQSGFECLSCELIIDTVGAKIPLLRAVGRRARAEPHPVKPRRGAVGYGLRDVLNPHVWLCRLSRGKLYQKKTLEAA